MTSAALDTARFYAILDTAYVPRTRWRSVCAALIAGGADLVQVRAKRESPSEREKLVREVLPLFACPSSSGDSLSGLSPKDTDSSPRQPPAPNGLRRPILVINDDVELCTRIPGAGLHIGQDDTPPAEARARIGRDRVLGFSTHSWEQAAGAMALPAGTLSYFCIGPLFATQTKPDYVPVGLGLVHQVANTAPPLPWFAIGGITRANVDQVIAAGAKRVVVVSNVLLDPDPAGAIRTLKQQLPRD